MTYNPGDKLHIEVTVQHGTYEGYPWFICGGRVVPLGINGRGLNIIKHIPAPLPPHKAGDTFLCLGALISGSRLIVYIDNRTVLYELPGGERTCISRFFEGKRDAYKHIRWPD